MWVAALKSKLTLLSTIVAPLSLWVLGCSHFDCTHLLRLANIIIGVTISLS
jgi:hypothetical protein